MKNLKKFICVVLSLITVAVMFVLPVSAESCTCSNDPIVYVTGKQDIWLCDENGVPCKDENGEKIRATQFDGDISAMASKNIPLLAKALLSDSDEDWNALSSELLNDLMPLYEGKGVNGDGEVIDPVHYHMDKDKSYCTLNGATHGYGMEYSNYFNYDYRLPMGQLAAMLQDFVEEVKVRTGHDKVVIVARCGGAATVEAWLALYQEEKDFSDISSLVIMNSTGNGFHALENLFSGNLDVNIEGLYRLLNNYDLSVYLGEEWGETAELVLDSLRETYGINLTVDMVEKLFYKIKDSVISPLLREYYGCSGMMLSFLKDNFYESIDFIYPTQELKDEYAKVIADATLVHEKAIARSDELLKKVEDTGIYVGLICEYGFQPMPLTEDSKLVGDSTSTVKDQSYGATTSTVTGKLSDEYIAEREKAGYGNYISADKQIDASTGLFPETTWYIKNLDHDWFGSIHDLCTAMVRQQLTVSSGSYGQFLVYNDTAGGRLDPLQEVNANDVQWKTNLSEAEEGKATTNLLKKIIEWFSKFLDTIRVMVEGIVAAAKA